jgi:biopolymer transport protein TolQ
MKINMSGIDAILQASLVVQLTLLTLVGLSVVVWAVAIFKFRQISAIKLANIRFLNIFWKTTSLDNLNAEFESHKRSSVARVFRAGYLEMQKLAGQKKSEAGIHLSGADNLERELRKAMDIEVASLESRLTLLATTGSTGPFIGLFGTVWGLMNSFHKIGQTGSASLAIVAPGISEALIATAIGLAAAIPAVILYNHFIAEIKRQEMILNNFSTDFLNIVKRNFFKE